MRRINAKDKYRQMEQLILDIRKELEGSKPDLKLVRVLVDKLHDNYRENAQREVATPGDSPGGKKDPEKLQQGTDDVQQETGPMEGSSAHAHLVWEGRNDGLAFMSQTEDGMYHGKLFDILASNIPGTNVLYADDQMKVILANGREMEEYGYSKSHYEGKLLHDIWSSEESALLEPLYRKALNGKRVRREIQTGGEHYRVTVIPVRDRIGKVIGSLSVTTNITGERLKENDLEVAREKAESANKAKSEFMANMSHEIRTPLNSIIGFAEQLGKTSLKEEQRNFLNLIEDSSEHLLSIVNEILILMKIGAGSLYIEHVPFSVRNVFEQAVNVLKIRAQRKNLSFEYAVDKAVPEVLIGDPVRFRQILINLLSNAVKFTEFGYVKCSVRTSKLNDDTVELELKVRDSGIGIDKEEMNMIFTAFGQSDSSVTRKFGGSGLGLTIVKELVELQGGKIHVSSRRKRGATFTVAIPFKIGKPEELFEEDHTVEFNTSLIRGLQILVVDDDETNRLLAKTILNSWRAHFDEAEDGDRALKMLDEKKYDLVLMDIHMPDISGVDIVKKVREDSAHLNRNTKFVAVTANIVRSDLKQYEQAGMDDHLVKPYREEKLFEKISKVMNLRAEKNVDLRGGEGKTQLESEKNVRKLYDLSELINLSKGDAYFFNKTLRSYVETAEFVREDLSSLTIPDDSEVIGERAHKLISSSRFLGLSDIANICIRIEDGTLKGIGNNVPELVEQLIGKLDEILPQLKNEYIRS